MSPLSRLQPCPLPANSSCSTCIIDIVRLVIFIDIPQNNIDVTWIYIPPSIWLDLESSIAILVACLPVMRPLLHPKRFWYQSRMTYASHTHADAHDDDDDDGDVNNEMDTYSHEKSIAAMAHERDGSSSSATGSQGMRNGEEFPQGNAV